MLKLAYKFDVKTFEYIGSLNVQENPKHPGQWLMPSNCTLVKPMDSQEHKIPCWKDNKWVLVSDYRKCDFYDIHTQEKHTIAELGVEPSEDWTDKAPADKDQVWNGTEWVYPESVIIAKKKEQVRSVRDSYIDGIEWRIDRYKDQKEMGMETTDSEVEYHKVLSYMQYLRDYPTSSETWYETNPLTWEEWRERSN